MYSPATEFERVFDPKVLNEVEMGTKEEHVIRKLMDLDESMPHSACSYPIFERLVALELCDMASAKGELMVLAHVNSANDHHTGSSVSMLI